MTPAPRPPSDSALGAEATATAGRLPGLVLEGGGMRGLFTAGVLDTLFAAGVRFGGIVGVSAGAAFGCNYKSRQPGRVLRYNLRFCRDRRYWGLGSLLRTGDLFNAEFCYRTLPRVLDPWDAAAFEADPTRFWAVATDADTGEPVYAELAKGDDRACDWIRASSSMPIVSRPVGIDGRRYLDGGLSDSVPLARMQSFGFARNVVVLTRPASYRKGPERLWTMRPFLRGLPAVVAALERRPGEYNRSIDFVEAEEAKGTAFVFRPPAEIPIRRVSRSRRAVQAAYDLGRAVAERELVPLREWLRY
jgi:predicted patatin/cPLA2 family phospholipase